VPRLGSPEDEEKWHPKVWEKNRKGGRQLREDLARDIGWCIDMY